MARTGLARTLSKQGFCSRQQAVQLIRAGRVCLNGQLCRDPERPVLFGRDQVQVDGVQVTAERTIYLLLNKPRGLVTTRSDEQGRRTVFDCLAPETHYPAQADASLPLSRHFSAVGRLDKASEGLLLFTNDNAWANAITDPAHHLEKTYHVQVSGRLDEPLLDRLRSGISSDGEFLQLIHVRILRQGEKNTWLEIVLDEGRNRHIRRMLDAFDIEVLRLIRVAIGPLVLDDLPKGRWRFLSAAEAALLSPTSP